MRQYIVVVGLALGLAVRCIATTVVVLVTEHGIVVCADGKDVIHRAGKDAGSGVVQKVVVVQNRFAVAHIGLRGFGKNEPYSVDRVFREIQAEVPQSSTPEGVANLIRAKLASEFRGFDRFLRGPGSEQILASAEEGRLTRFTEAGYDGPMPHVYEITVSIDRESRTVKEPTIKSSYPQSNRRHLNLFVYGSHVGIEQLFKTTTQTSIIEHASMPVEVEALVRDQDLDFARMVRLGRRLVEIEIEQHPEAVGYPITEISIPKGAAVTTQTYRSY